MKTISVNRSLNEDFKRAQLLPPLDPKIMARLQAIGSWSVVQPASSDTVKTTRPRQPRAAHSALGPTFPTVLTLSALVLLGQALSVLTDWPTNWIALAAWMGRLVG